MKLTDIEILENYLKKHLAKHSITENWQLGVLLEFGKYYHKQVKNNDSLDNVSHSMTGDGMNCLEFFDMIKKEWCISEEQYKPFWNDVLTFARKYHKERNEYCG